MILLSADQARKLLSYDEKTGLCRWLVSRTNRIHVGDIAGHLDKSIGYYVIRIDGRKYGLHRVIWLWMKGEWPKNDIDHKDLDGTNNQWLNLREATHSQNHANKRLLCHSKSGLKGVHLRGRKWRALIKINGKRISLGTYDTPEKAHAIYYEAAKRLFGEFARAA